LIIPSPDAAHDTQGSLNGTSRFAIQVLASHW